MSEIMGENKGGNFHVSHDALPLFSHFSSWLDSALSWWEANFGLLDFVFFDSARLVSTLNINHWHFVDMMNYFFTHLMIFLSHLELWFWAYFSTTVNTWPTDFQLCGKYIFCSGVLQEKSVQIGRKGLQVIVSVLRPPSTSRFPCVWPRKIAFFSLFCAITTRRCQFLSWAKPAKLAPISL